VSHHFSASEAVAEVDFATPLWRTACITSSHGLAASPGALLLFVCGSDPAPNRRDQGVAEKLAGATALMTD
jgi:hypothetical protein